MENNLIFDNGRVSLFASPVHQYQDDHEDVEMPKEMVIMSDR
jgi:hypothetical protein